MSGQRWVHCGLDYAAHLLRPSAEPPGVVTARCGQEMQLSMEAIEHPAVLDRACAVCKQLHRLDLVSEGIEALLAASSDQEDRLTDAQREALQELLDDLAARTPPDG